MVRTSQQEEFPRMVLPRFSGCVCVCVCAPLCWKWGKKKPINIKNFGGTPPWCVSHLSRHMSLPRTFCPLNVNFHINRPKRPECPWDVLNLSLGRFQGIMTTKFLYVMFLHRAFFVLHRKSLCCASRFAWQGGGAADPRMCSKGI